MNTKQNTFLDKIINLLIFLLFLFATCCADFFSIDLGVAQMTLPRLFIALLLICLLFKGTRIRLQPDRNIRFVEMTFIAMLVYGLISVIWVKDLEGWVRAYYFYTFGILSIFIIVYNTRFKNRFLPIIAFFLMAVVLSVFGWYEVITRNFLFLSDASLLDFYKFYGSPVAWCGNTNDYALYIGLNVLLAIILLSSTRNIFLKLFLYIYILSAILLIIIAGSRATFIGLMIGIFFYVVRSIRNIKIGYVFIPVLIIGIFLSVMDDQFIYLFQDFMEEVTEIDTDSSGSDGIRMGLLMNGVHFLVQTLGFGVGPGNIEYYMENDPVYYTGGMVNIHNFWMEILVSFGILIFVLFMVSYVFLFFRQNLIIRTADDHSAGIARGMQACLVFFIMGLITSSSAMTSEWVWIFLGLIIYYSKLEDDEICLYHSKGVSE